VPLKLGAVRMPRDREEEELTLDRRHLPVEQAVSAAGLHTAAIHRQRKSSQCQRELFAF